MKTVKSILLSIIILNSIVIYCQADQKDFPVLEGSYLGQKPPSTIPKIFAPVIVSTPENLEIGCTWSSDVKEFYFVRQSNNRWMLLYSKLEESGWTEPEEVEQLKKFPGFEPFISGDGKKFLYTRFALPPEIGNNPDAYTKEEKQQRMVNIWAMDKNGSEFSNPKYCVPGMFCSEAANGNLYVTLTTGDNQGIIRYIYKDGSYGDEEFLGGGVNLPVIGAHPCIAPDESFIIFDSKRSDDHENADLYICFKQADDSWSEAYSLGDEINTKWNDICPSLSPDGKYLFYMSKADIYWVSTEIFLKLNLIK